MVTYRSRVSNDDDLIFKALADPTRRFLLDLLFTRDGRTLRELESELEMTRFGVSQHLQVLAGAARGATSRANRKEPHEHEHGEPHPPGLPRVDQGVPRADLGGHHLPRVGRT